MCAATNRALSRWLVAWVGDCRVYRVGAADRQPAELLTRDDTYRHLDEVSPPGGSPDDPARMIGNGAVEAPNLRDVELRTEEMLVLCSDGVHRHANAEDIGRLLRGSTPLVRRCVKLVEFVRSRGNHDDATVLVLQRSASAGAPFPRSLLITGLAALALGAIATLASDTKAAPDAAPPLDPSNPVQVKR